MKSELKHLAIIMDGNGRWAIKKGLSRSIGHKKGADTLKRISKYIFEKDIKVLSVFAFSTENWKRSKEEVDYLMDLFVYMFKNNFEELKKMKVKIVFSGVKEKLNDTVLNLMKELQEDTKEFDKYTFNICLNYGGQSEIVEACKKIIKDKDMGLIKIEDLNEELFSKYLFNDLPPIDLLVRTSGEYRISNFMLWQLAYSELYFIDKHWPSFSKKDVDKLIDAYYKRDRRYGSVKNKN